MKLSREFFNVFRRKKPIQLEESLAKDPWHYWEYKKRTRSGVTAQCFFELSSSSVGREKQQRHLLGEDHAKMRRPARLENALGNTMFQPSFMSSAHYWLWRQMTRKSQMCFVLFSKCKILLFLVLWYLEDQQGNQFWRAVYKVKKASSPCPLVSDIYIYSLVWKLRHYQMWCWYKRVLGPNTAWRSSSVSCTLWIYAAFLEEDCFLLWDLSKRKEWEVV